MTAEELSVRIELVRNGDMTAFEEIYTELKTPVYTLILRITRDRALAEDIMQEVFVRLFCSPPGSDVRNQRAYIFKIARNLAIDGTRRRTAEASLDEMEDVLPAPEHDMSLKPDVERALAALPPDERQIVTLHLNGALTFREIAKIMAQPLGTVLWRYRRAVSTLQNKLGGAL